MARTSIAVVTGVVVVVALLLQNIALPKRAAISSSSTGRFPAFAVGSCELGRVDGRGLSWQKFLEDHGQEPVIITHALEARTANDSAWAPESWTKEAFMLRFGKVSSLVSGDNFIADQFMAEQGRDKMFLIQEFASNLNLWDEGDDAATVHVKRGVNESRWTQTRVPEDRIPLPSAPFAAPPDGPRRVGAYISLGEDSSGAIFHSHVQAAVALLRGQKHWFFYPPEKMPNMTRDVAVASALLRAPGTWKQLPSIAPLQCTQQASEVLWIPAWWWHATLNVGDSLAAISQFQTPQSIHQRYPRAIFSLRKTNQAAVCSQYPFQFQVVVPAVQDLLKHPDYRQEGAAQFLQMLANLKWLVEENVIEKQQALSILVRMPVSLFSEELQRLAGAAFPELTRHWAYEAMQAEIYRASVQKRYYPPEVPSNFEGG